jgi:hypothetical protein
MIVAKSLEVVEFEREKMRQALKTISKYAGFMRRLFDETGNEKHLRQALENIESDAKGAAEGD